MAASSGNGGRRSSGRSSGKAEKQSRKTPGDDSDNKICGFHPLRSLRNIFFGYRTRWRESSVDEVDAVAVETPPATKAKSTDDIAHHHHQQQQDYQDDPTKAVVHPPVINTNSANPSHRQSRPSVIPLVSKQLSKSADNLASPSDWIPAPHGIPSAVNSPSGSEDSNLNANNMGEIDDSAVLDPNSVDEFFTDNWSQACNSRTRAFSSGDAERVSDDLTFDLDSVDQTKALDVSAAKNRIAIKPTNKRLTVAMQQKMLRAETTPRPARTYHLPSLTEAGEDGDGGKKEPKTDASAAAAADAEAPPDRPIRREKRPNLPAPDKSGRMTISITPDMLAVARKKASDRGGPGGFGGPGGLGGLGGPGGAGGGNPSVVVQTGTASPTRPPPPTCPKKRKTYCEPTGGASSVPPHEEKKKEELGEASSQNGPASGISVAMRPVLLSVKEDEALTGEEEEDAVARPKAPPRVRPKPRPKTMMHAPGTTKTTEAEPEWVTNRANKKNALVD